MIRLLSGPELADQWHKLKPLVEKALVHGGGVVTSHGLFLQCLGAVGQCWIREEGEVCITRFEEIEGKKQLAVVACTSPGWFTHGPEILKILEDFARFNGCKRTVVYGRKGWARALKQYGYNEPFITLTKEV
jgi:hypothetical protein|tara:strand:- start:443 stop:838 length:396 start_codon:yes stop_codon:yes gene_type:complete